MQEFYFSGTIERVIFENASNFFRILLLEIDETDSDFEDYEIIVTGTMGDVMEGEDYTFWGQLTNHPKYGEQLFQPFCLPVQTRLLSVHQFSRLPKRL